MTKEHSLHKKITSDKSDKKDYKCVVCDNRVSRKDTFCEDCMYYAMKHKIKIPSDKTYKKDYKCQVCDNRVHTKGAFCDDCKYYAMKHRIKI